MTDDDVELVARAISDWRGREVEGCWSNADVCDDTQCECMDKSRRLAQTIFTALRAAGWQKVPADCVVVKIGNHCERYPYCGCTGGLMTSVVCIDRAMIEAVKVP